jgi:putative endonuclease
MVRAMTKRNQAVGAYGESCAVRHLIGAGLRPVARNWRCPAGEIDIIAWDGPVLAFCEVKTRRTTDYGTPAEAVVPAKARRLRGLAVRWLAETGTTAGEVRFDVLSVELPDAGAARVEHLKGAF